MKIDTYWLASLIKEKIKSAESNFGTPISAENEGYYKGKIVALTEVLTTIKSVERKFVPLDSLLCIIDSMEGLTDEQKDTLSEAIEEEWTHERIC